MAASTRPRPMRRASRRGRWAASSPSAPHGGRRAPGPDAPREMIETDDGFLPLLTRRAQANPDGLFARYEGAPLTFGELDRRATALAVWMRSIGLKPGDGVALMIRNSPVALALLFAIAKARAVWVPVNVQSRGENLGYILDHSAPKLVIAEAELHATIAESAANLAGAQRFSIEAVQSRGARLAALSAM